MIQKAFRILLGLAILLLFFYFSYLVVNLLHLSFPPAILGLILFSLSLLKGVIKEEWVKEACELFLKNMAMLFVPFIVGLIVYKSLLFENGVSILLVVLFSTIITLVFTGLFVELGIKYLRLYKIRKNRD